MANIVKHTNTPKLATDALSTIVSSSDVRLGQADYALIEKDVIVVIVDFMAAFSPYPECTNLYAVKMFAELIITGYPHWKLADVSNFFKWFLQNQHIGELQITGNKITYLKLAQVIPLYELNRIDVILSKNSTSGDNNTNRTGVSVEAKKVIGQILNRIKPAYGIRELSAEELEQQRITTSILAEFDKLWADQNTHHSGIRYVTLSGVIYYITDWEKERKFGELKDYGKGI